MNQTLIISFWVRKNRKNKRGLVPIVMRLFLTGKRVDLQPGLYVEPINWDTNKMRVKAKATNAVEVNDSLDIIRTKIWGIYQRSLGINQVELEDLIEQYRNGGIRNHKVLELVRKHNEDFFTRLSIDRSHSTFEKYRFTEQKVAAYISKEHKKSDVVLSVVNKLWMEQFYLFLRKEEQNQHNTAVKYVKNLKHILTYGVELGWLENNPAQGFKCSFKLTEQTILGPDELERIEQKRFDIPRLERARKLFLLQCYTGLSYTDLQQLQPDNFEEGPDGKIWLNMRRQKTDSAVRFPVLIKATNLFRELIELDNTIVKNNDRKLLKSLPIQKMNSYLKEIADLCGITKRLSTHVGRRTMASTVLLGNGVPISTISKVLGHQNVETTKIYAKVSDRMLSVELSDLEKKLNPNQTDEV